MSEAFAVRLHDVVKRFGAFTAVDHVSFEIGEGEVFGLLGSNGAGKSTTIRILCGLLRPTSGSANVLGFDVARESDAVKASVGYMTQRFSLYEDLTVEQNARFFGGIYGLKGGELRERTDWALRKAGLVDKKTELTRALAGGWRQRLALACSILHRPRLVFLDEPTGGVDPLSRRRFWRLIDELAEDGVTIIVTTHYLDEAERCDRVALMHDGRVVALGSVEQLKSAFEGRALYEVACHDYARAQETMEKEPWVREASLFGIRLHVLLDEREDPKRIESTLRAAAVSGEIAVSPIVPSLEDVFIHHINEIEQAREARAGES